MTKEAKQVKKANQSNDNGSSSKADKLYHVIILALAGVLMFVGVMSLVQADPIVRYTIAGVVVFFIVKDLFRS